MDQLRNTLPINERKYDRAVETVRAELGSLNTIASLCYGHTGKTITGSAINRWFQLRAIPVEYAAVFADLTLGQVSVLDFYPWLEEYIK
jgi:hypothetical protein